MPHPNMQVAGQKIRRVDDPDAVLTRGACRPRDNVHPDTWLFIECLAISPVIQISRRKNDRDQQNTRNSLRAPCHRFVSLFTGLKGKNSIARGCQPLARPSPDLMLTAHACNTSVIL